MALNLELKISINSKKNIIDKILCGGGKYISSLNQIDTYFTFNKGLLKLRNQNGENQLIKYNRNETETDRWSNYSVLFLKGEEVLKYLTDLFDIEVEVKKERKLYIYKNTRIHIDKVSRLGNYLELETMVDKISLEEAKNEFNEVVDFLKLDLEHQIRKSYRDLLLKV